MQIARATELAGALVRRCWLRLQATLWLVLNRPRRAERVFGALLQHRPGDAYALASRAHLRAQTGQLQAALADARALTALYPQRCAADWFNLAFLLDEAGRPVEAESAFRRAIALQPTLDRAWYGLGMTLIRLQRPDEAIGALQRNTELQPMSPFGWVQLARVQLQRGDFVAAQGIVMRLQAFEPGAAAQLEQEIGRALRAESRSCS